MKARSLSALVTALAVLAVLVVQKVLGDVFVTVGAVVGGENNSLWQSLTPGLFTFDVAFALGVFLSLWYVAPITAQLRLHQVITRGVLATAAGAVVAGVVQVIIGVYGAFEGPLGAMRGFDADAAHHGIGQGFTTAASYFIGTVPLVVLAGIVLWMWLGRHPRVEHDARIAGDV